MGDGLQLHALPSAVLNGRIYLRLNKFIGCVYLVGARPHEVGLCPVLNKP